MPQPAIPATAFPAHSKHPAARVGPNAIIQLGATLRDRVDGQAAEKVFGQCGLLKMLRVPPTEMVRQSSVAVLFDALFKDFPPDVATAVARDAGRRTGGYILQHRIPPPARVILQCLPPAISARLLSKAIERHAWTFAGSGVFSVKTSPKIAMEIAANPLAMPGCVWHVAVFEQLFRSLCSPAIVVRHTQCCLDGAGACRFEVDLKGGRK